MSAVWHLDTPGSLVIGMITAAASFSLPQGCAGELSIWSSTRWGFALVGYSTTCLNARSFARVLNRIEPTGLSGGWGW